MDLKSTNRAKRGRAHSKNFDILILIYNNSKLILLKIGKDIRFIKFYTVKVKWTHTVTEYIVFFFL